MKVIDATGSDSENALTIDHGVEYDFVVKVESGEVTFWYRTAGGAWSDPPIVFVDEGTPADHTPDDDKILRFSAAVKETGDDDDSLILRVFENTFDR